MPTADEVLAIAYSQIGYQEADDGGEYKFCPAMGWDVGSQWCGIFQEWCIIQAGGSRGDGGTVPLLHFTPSAAQAYQERGDWSLTPVRGAHCFFDWGGASLGSDVGLIDHIGIVADASTWDQGYITTVEGNITQGGNPSVGEFIRSVAVLSGFGLPRYSPGPSPTTDTPIALPEMEDEMIVLKNPKGWNVILGDRLVPIGGAQHFNPEDPSKVTYVRVSDTQLAGIKAKFAA